MEESGPGRRQVGQHGKRSGRPHTGYRNAVARQAGEEDEQAALARSKRIDRSTRSTALRRSTRWPAERAAAASTSTCTGE